VESGADAPLRPYLSLSKALDQVRPGGVVAFITSKGTMDKQSPEVRKYIAQRAELLGAIRLPNNAFRANAGTEVTSDILFLQKRDRPIDIEPDWVHLGQTADGIPVNSYFAEHPEMVLGTMVWDDSMYGARQETACLPIEGAAFSAQLAEAVTHITGSYQAVVQPELGEGETIRESIPADPDVRNYSYNVVGGQVYYRENSVMVQPDLNATVQERIKGMVALRDCVHRLMDAQLQESDDYTIAALQGELNTLYDSFTAKYGLINSRPNAQAFSDDSSYYLLSSLEILDDNGNLERKADMFTKRTIRQQHTVEHVDTAVEALAVSIAEKAKVDLPYMAELTGKPKEELIADLHGVIFQIPKLFAEDLTPEYVTADEYLSGNVRQKLREAESAARHDPSFAVNVQALQAAQPKDLDASEIDVRLGATWVDKQYIQQFMQELFEIPFYQRRAVQVQYSQYTSEWRISGKTSLSYNNVANSMTYGTDRAPGLRILEDTLNLRDVRIYDTVEDAEGKEKRVLNQKATTLAQQKQQAIKDAFREWIWKDPQRREALVAQYNELFNSVRPREYDGRHITFSGMNPEIVLREHQRNAIAHTLYGGNTLLAHVVGAGKSATRS
jgi:N12 class adenine-specific DNA methylase